MLTSDGSISFLDITAACFTAQLQLTLPGSRASSFSTDARANSMAVVCSDGLVRLYDLATVRRAAQQQRSTQQVHKLLEPQLQQLPAGIFSTAGSVNSTSGQLMGPGEPGQPPLQVLTDVANMPARKTGKATKLDKRALDISKPPVRVGQLQTQPLDAAAAALNKQKLQDMLKVYGEFPARYRPLIW